MKNKLIVVGSFNAKRYGVVGGVARSCDELMDSDFIDSYEVIPVDSTQRTNPPPVAFKRAIYSAARFIHFFSSLVKNRPQGVLLFTSSGLSFIEKCVMAWVARAFGAKTFLFPRAGSLIEWSNSNRISLFFSRIMMRGGNVFFAQGPTWKEFAVDVGGFSSDNIATIPNWTAIESHISLGDKKLLTESYSSIPTLAFVGWLEREKGILELLEACKILNNTGIPFKLLIAGDGTEQANVYRLIKMYNLDSCVVCMGWLKGDSLTKVYEQSDIFVLPSWSEGLPNALVEAMSFGLCPVVTRVGMIPDYLIDDVHGKLVNPKDIDGLVSALKIVIEDHKFRRSCAKSAHMLANSFSGTEVIPLLCSAIDNHLRK